MNALDQLALALLSSQNVTPMNAYDTFFTKKRFRGCLVGLVGQSDEAPRNLMPKKPYVAIEIPASDERVTAVLGEGKTLNDLPQSRFCKVEGGLKPYPTGFETSHRAGGAADGDWLVADVRPIEPRGARKAGYVFLIDQEKFRQMAVNALTAFAKADADLVAVLGYSDKAAYLTDLQNNSEGIGRQLIGQIAKKSALIKDQAAISALTTTAIHAENYGFSGAMNALNSRRREVVVHR